MENEKIEKKKKSGCLGDMFNFLFIGTLIKILTDLAFGSNPKFEWIFPTLIIVLIIVLFYRRDKREKENKEEVKK